MNFCKNSLWFCLFLFAFASCRISKTYYAQQYSDWKQNEPPAAEKLKYQVFLIGDAGDVIRQKKGAEVLSLFKRRLEGASANSAAVYLGDNIYNAGLPDSADPKRDESEQIIKLQLDVLKNFKGKAFFVPGNHDWGYSLHEAHSDRVKRENAYVEKYLNRKDVFVPQNGCPGPVTVNLDNDLTLVVMDPDWLLESGYRKGTTCGDITEDGFKKQLNDAVAANKGKNIIIAAHQPLFSTGPHSGYVGWKPHFFPLTDINKYLYIPLPVLGSIYALVRATGMSHQDLHNKHYRKYINTVLSAVQGTSNVVMVAGHEHTLEYFEHGKDLHEVLSGAGSKLSKIRKTKKLGFGAHKNGFSVINYYNNGEAWVEYWAAQNRNEDGKLLFRTKMYTK